MIKKRYIVMSVGVVSVLLGSLVYNNIILAQSGGEYDPWLDYNEDGVVDVNDLHSLGQVYSSSGDPTKNVTVANWPISRSVTVFFDQVAGGGVSLWSGVINASGFGHLHVLMTSEDLTGAEELAVEIWGMLWDPSHTSAEWVLLEDYVVELNSTRTNAHASFPVPSEEFLIRVYGTMATMGYISLSYYLTWS